LLVLRKTLNRWFLLCKDNLFFVRKNWFLNVATTTFAFQNVSLSFIYGSGLHNTLTASLSLGPSILSSICAFAHQSVCISFNPSFRSSIWSYILPGIYIWEGRNIGVLIYTYIYIHQYNYMNIYIYISVHLYFLPSIHPAIIICNVECLETVGCSRYVHLLTDRKSRFRFQKSLMPDFIQNLVDVFHTPTYSFLLKVTSCFPNLYLIFLPSYA
jgi:hypothetical protein